LADEGAETHPDCLVEKIPDVGRIATGETINLFDQSLPVTFIHLFTTARLLCALCQLINIQEVPVPQMGYVGG
jgi:hypothetical protein